MCGDILSLSIIHTSMWFDLQSYIGHVVVALRNEDNRVLHLPHSIDNHEPSIHKQVSLILDHTPLINRFCFSVYSSRPFDVGDFGIHTCV